MPHLDSEPSEAFFAPSFPEELVVPETFDLSFTGFGEEAFAILDRLRAQPHIEQYRKEKAGIDAHIMRPFKQYRDDLAVNLILPNFLPFETERNVFSRLLKNDFGAGGCHHHLWMSFYRLGGKRLADIQMPHSLDPDGLSVGLWVGTNAPRKLKTAKSQVTAYPDVFAGLVERLRRLGNGQLQYYVGAGSSEQVFNVGADLNGFMDSVGRASGIWVRRPFTRDEVLAMAGSLVREAAVAMRDLWPLYLFLAGESHLE